MLLTPLKVLEGVSFARGAFMVVGPLLDTGCLTHYLAII